MRTPLPADPSDTLVGRGDVASPLLGLDLDEDDLGDGSESLPKEDEEDFTVRTGRRGRVPAIHLLSVYNDSPTGTNPDTPTHYPRNLRKKRINITST